MHFLSLTLIASGAFAGAKPVSDQQGASLTPIPKGLSRASHKCSLATHNSPPTSLQTPQPSEGALGTILDLTAALFGKRDTTKQLIGSRDEPQAYQTKVLNAHNVHRRNHTAQDLHWNSTLEAAAKVLSDRCVFEHNTSINHGGYGQNVGAGSSPDNVDGMITDIFYNGEFAAYTPYFGQSHPDMSDFEDWAHLTQLLWDDTSEVGCYTSYCANLIDGRTGKPMEGIGPWLMVCNYVTWGNIDGEYQHVHKPEGHPSVTVV